MRGSVIVAPPATVPADRAPALVYIASLAPGSRRTMKKRAARCALPARHLAVALSFWTDVVPSLGASTFTQSSNFEHQRTRRTLNAGPPPTVEFIHDRFSGETMRAMSLRLAMTMTVLSSAMVALPGCADDEAAKPKTATGVSLDELQVGSRGDLPTCDATNESMLAYDPEPVGLQRRHVRPHRDIVERFARGRDRRLRRLHRLHRRLLGRWLGDVDRLRVDVHEHGRVQRPRATLLRGAAGRAVTQAFAASTRTRTSPRAGRETRPLAGSPPWVRRRHRARAGVP